MVDAVLTKEQAREMLLAAAQIVRAMVDTVADLHPEPAIEGPMYAAFMQSGGSLRTFQKLMAQLVKLGLVRYIGNHQFVLSEQEITRRNFAPLPYPVKSQDYFYANF